MANNLGLLLSTLDGLVIPKTQYYSHKNSYADIRTFAYIFYGQPPSFRDVRIFHHVCYALVNVFALWINGSLPFVIQKRTRRLIRSC